MVNASGWRWWGSHSSLVLCSAAMQALLLAGAPTLCNIAGNATAVRQFATALVEAECGGELLLQAPSSAATHSAFAAGRLAGLSSTTVVADGVECVLRCALGAPVAQDEMRTLYCPAARLEEATRQVSDLPPPIARCLEALQLDYDTCSLTKRQVAPACWPRPC